VYKNTAHRARPSFQLSCYMPPVFILLHPHTSIAPLIMVHCSTDQDPYQVMVSYELPRT